MKNRKLHISEYPIQKFESQNPRGISHRLATRGKPVGLWYATGLEWVDRMQKVLSWEVTGNREDFPYTRGVYNKINTETLDLWTKTNANANANTNLNEGRAVKGSRTLHFVYDLTFDPSLYSEDIHRPSKERILKLTPTCLDHLYTELYLPFQEKYFRERLTTGVRVNIEEFLGTARMNYYIFSKNKEKFESYSPEAQKQVRSYAELYAYLLRYFYDTKQLTKLMMRRYETNEEEVKLDSEKYVDIILKDVRSGKLPLKSYMYQMFNRIWGVFWETEIAPKWGGIDFPHALFTEEYMNAHPQFPWIPKVEIPSGVFYQVPKETPKLYFVVSWSLPSNLVAQLESIKRQLMTVYTEEDADEILKTRTYIAVPTKKGDIKFLKVPVKAVKDV